MLGMAGGSYHLDASEQMRRRPMAPLLNAMRALGCTITCEGEEDHFPFTIISSGITASEATVNIDDSSQFLSALLMAAPVLDHDFRIDVTGSHGMAYVEMTARMMQQFLSTQSLLRL
jgi:3-phosphoshikimate 1-carboxyvinyltransferase